MRPQFFIKNVKNIGYGEIFGAIDGRFKVTPERCQ